MNIKSCLNLLNKIDAYTVDKTLAGEILPAGKTGMKIRAVTDYLLYGTSFSEYFAYRFYALNRAEKKTFMTRRHMFRFFDRYNPKEYRDRIGDKRLTHLYYGDMMKRDQFDYREGFDAFVRFTKEHPRLFIKRAFSWGGEGAYFADCYTSDRIKAEWEKLDENSVIEERLENCEQIKRLHPGSLNTIKVVTLWINGRAEIQTALFRMGYNKPVDNVHLGGICALVDIDSGAVFTKAFDHRFQEYVAHPVTGEQIVGFLIPMWEEVKGLARKAAAVTPEMRYTSWDIAVTEKGPVLIEGNWDAEFYSEQMLMLKGIRKRYCEKLEASRDSSPAAVLKF
ncbi:MAG: hypothetical protein IJK63_01245 [Oscillospiraceae bacterium]|nr:hypothetical protein [Oscillospiraceae bacterium]